MMSAEKVRNGLTCAALGAFVAYVGFSLTGAGRAPAPLPMLFAMGMGLTGIALVTKAGRRAARPRPIGERALALSGRFDTSDSVPAFRLVPALALAPAPAPEKARQGDAALLGHEMKNYLCTLKGNARLLRLRSKGGDGDIIDRIDRVVEKLESFTKTMTADADATSSGVLWHLDMGDAAKACVRTHFHGASESFRWNIRPDAPTLLGDPDRLEQVFLNLFANAREAGAQKVMTSVAREGERLQVCIEDDGKGCAPEDLDRIFEPFFSTQSGPARRGLGMFIVQSIVENHGGTIKARCKNGDGDGAHGLVFLLDFPLSLPAATAPSGRIRTRLNPALAAALVPMETTRFRPAQRPPRFFFRPRPDSPGPRLRLYNPGLSF